MQNILKTEKIYRTLRVEMKKSRHLFLYFLCLFPLLVQAECLFVFSEISPKKIENETEWIEIEVQGNRDELCSLKNRILETENKTIRIEDTIDSLSFSYPERIIQTESDTSIHLPNEPFFLWWNESPIPLPDDGQTLFLKKNNTIQDTITYPKTKSGTIQGKSYTEIWNRNPFSPTVFPQRYEPDSPFFHHTKGSKNNPIPTLPEEKSILINEVSALNTEADFIEFLIQKDNTNLKGISIKHNGTTLFEQKDNFFMDSGEYFVLEFGESEQPIQRTHINTQAQTSKKNGLSGGSGTIEIRGLTGTSYEQIIDTVCWKKKNLSQTELKRVKTYQEQNEWNGDCIEIQESIPNESIGRKQNTPDTNTKNDFWRHFNGSKGSENISQNSPPKAIIEIQGGKKIYTDSLNLTGDTSFDSDGKSDIQSFQWSINGKQCPESKSDGWRWSDHCDIESKRSNPKTLYFDKKGFYTIALKVTDFSGETDILKTDIEVTEKTITPQTRGGGSQSPFHEASKKWIEKNIEKNKPKASTSFFGAFLQSITAEKLDWIQKNPIPIPLFLKENPKPQSQFQRDNLSNQEKKRIKKNTGLAFSLFIHK